MPKPHDNTKLSALIHKGYSNEEIRAELGFMSPDRIYNCRKKLGMVQGIRSSYDTHQEPTARHRPAKKLGNHCPKCGGHVLHGGVRFGVTAPEISSCLLCGLNSESVGYFDAINNVWREFLW